MKLLYVKFTLIITVIALVITIIACNRDSLLQDVNIEVGTELLYNPVNVQIIDGKLDGTIPQNITVSIIGKDKDKIYSVFGEKAITVSSYGILNLGIPKNYTASIDAPIEFMVVINAPGYLEARKNFIVTDIKSNVFEDARMVNLSSPPKGVSISSDVVIPVDGAKGVMKDIYFSTPSATGKTENATVKVLAGTKMFDKDGNTVTGDVKVSLVHFDAVNETSLRCYPGGFNFSGAIDSSGKSIEGGQFYTYGFIALSMSANDKVVKTFSQPINVELEINVNTFDPLLDRNIQVGDTIPIWSLNDVTGKWTLESYPKVTIKNSKLVVNYNQAHFSSWSLNDWTCKWGCGGCQKPYITVLSDFTTNLDNSYSFYLGHIPLFPQNYTSGSAYSFSGNVNDLKNGSIIRITSNVPSNFRVGGRIYYLEKENNRLYEYIVPWFYPCYGEVLDLRGKLPIKSQPPKINLFFSAVCANESPKLPTGTIFPSTYIYYKEIGTNLWNTLSYINIGKGTAQGLIPGKRYKLGIFDGPFIRTTDELGLKNGFIMPYGDTTIAIKSTRYGFNETFKITKNLISNEYDLEYLNIPLSAELCAQYRKYFR